MPHSDLFFSDEDSFAVQQHLKAAVESEIAGIDGNRLLNTNMEDLVTYIVDKYRLDIPVLDEANMSVDQQEAQRDVSGDPRRMSYYSNRPVHVTCTEVIVEVPFTGDPQMFRIQPSTHSLSPPRGEVRGNAIIFRHWSDTPQAQQVRGEVDRWLTDIKQHLQWQQVSFRQFNDGLPGIARRAITNRRENLLANQNLVAGLGIPLKRRPGSTGTYTAPEVKRKLTPRMPPATIGAYKLEPVLEEAEYQHILDVIDNMGKVMERSPRAFHDIDEEALRTHFLVQLNGHYEG